MTIRRFVQLPHDGVLDPLLSVSQTGDRCATSSVEDLLAIGQRDVVSRCANNFVGKGLQASVEDAGGLDGLGIVASGPSMRQHDEERSDEKEDLMDKSMMLF